MRITRVLILTAIMLPATAIGYYSGYQHGSPVTIEVVAPSGCMPLEEVEPPLF